MQIKEALMYQFEALITLIFCGIFIAANIKDDSTILNKILIAIWSVFAVIAFFVVFAIGMRFTSYGLRAWLDCVL